MKKFLTFFLFSLFFINLSFTELDFPYSQIIEKVITPHTRWAKPYYYGKIKVLLISPAYSQRETIELAERLDMDYVQIPVPLTQTQYRRETWNYLRGKIEDRFDVIVMGAIKWKSIPEDIRDKIIEKIKNGTGFLFVDPQGLERKIYTLFKNGKIQKQDLSTVSSFPFRKIPHFSKFKDEKDFAKEYISESKIGKGYACFLTYKSGRGELLYLTPENKCNFVEYDYSLSFICKLLLKLARKMPEMRIVSVEIKEGKIEGEIRGMGIEQTKIYLRIRNEEGENEFESREENKSTIFSIPLPFLPSGTHFVDVFLKKDAKVIDWYSTYIEIPDFYRIKILSEKEGYLPREIVKGEIEIYGIKNTEGKQVEINLKDGFNRLIFSQKYPPEEKIPFSFPSFQPLTIAHIIEVKILKQSKPIQKKIKLFPVKLKKDISDFFFVIWGGPSENYLENYPFKLIVNYGVDSALCYCNERKKLEKIVLANLHPYPYIFSLKAHSRGKNLERHPCFSNPSFRESMRKILLERANLISPYAPLGYTLGDENELSHWNENYDFCFSKYCLQDLRKYLRGKYGSLEKLNKEWETSFTSWDEVTPITLSELIEKKERKNFSRWIDHRLHMDSVFADINYFGRKIIESVDKNAYVGAEGIWGEGNSFTGIDYYKLGKAMKAVGGYGGTPYWDTFLPSDRLLWDWGLYNSSVEKGKRYPWEKLLYGGNGIGYYSLLEKVPDYAAFNPDFTLTPQFSAVVESTREIKKGIGKLLLSGKAEFSPVAVLHSQPNLHLTTILSKTTWFNYNKAKYSLLRVLRELWYYPDILSREEIEKGILKNGSYKCLVLPSIFCLSKKEREEIKKFVKNGGIIIADVLPGLFDEHGKMVEENDMEDLFGVMRKKWPSTSTTGVEISGKKLSVVIPEELILKGGKTLIENKNPVFIENSYGSGKTLCLNLLTYT
ncbi:beta-galactosidase, partial [bacterium]|nr:beta-galactosidase [bacterium]